MAKRTTATPTRQTYADGILYACEQIMTRTHSGGKSLVEAVIGLRGEAEAARPASDTTTTEIAS